jgi:uncharacterized protein YndB with AHSA1/START domain
MSENRVAIERTVFIGAAPETVFGFLTDPVLLAQWLGRPLALDARPGGSFRVEVSRGNVAIGVFTEVTPSRRVAFTWGWESPDAALASLRPGSSLVEIELEPQKGGTLLRLRHSGLPGGLEEMHGERWSYHLDRLGRSAKPSKGREEGR